MYAQSVVVVVFILVWWSSVRVSTGLVSTNQGLEYASAIRNARCRARCLAQVGSWNVPKLDPLSQLLTIPATSTCSAESDPNCKACFQCLSTATESACGAEFGLASACTSPNELPIRAWSYHSLLEPPVALFHCSQKVGNSSFNAAFRIEFPNNHSHVLANMSRWNVEEIPTVFVIEVDLNGIVTYLVTESWLVKFLVPKSSILNLGLTAVSVAKVYTPTKSTPLQLHDSELRGHAQPQELRLVEIRRKHKELGSSAGGEDQLGSELEMLVQWKTGSGCNATCQFGLYAMHDLMERSERKTAEEAFWAVVGVKMVHSMKFGIQIDVRVFELGDGDEEQNPANLNVIMPTCLAFTYNDFNLCVPPAVSNLSAHLTRGSLMIEWSAPPYTNTTNRIEWYTVRAERLQKNIHGDTGAGDLFTTQVNQTQLEWPNVSFTGAIKVSVSANTHGGTSNPVSVTIIPPIQVVTSTLPKKLLATAGALILLILLIVAAFGIKNCVEKKQRKKLRHEYFETLSLNSGGEITQKSDELQTRYDCVYDSKWEIDGSCLEFKGQLGNGAFAIVMKAKLWRNGQSSLVAVKTLRAGAEVELFWEEFEILKGLGKHVHVVELIGVVSAEPALVVEYCNLGDLKSHLKQKKGFGNGQMVTNQSYFGDESTHSVSDMDMLSFARQIACGMEFLAKHRVVHRDLAARNILVTTSKADCQRILKIADFGLSRDVYEQNWYKMNSNGKIPVRWLALECLLQEMYTTKSDVWSYGIVLWEIVTLGSNPYPGVETSHIHKLLTSGYRMPKPFHCADTFYAIMRQCWAEDPNKRPHFHNIKAQLDNIIENCTAYFVLSEPTYEQSESPSDGDSAEPSERSEEPSESELFEEPSELLEGPSSDGQSPVPSEYVQLTAPAPAPARN